MTASLNQIDLSVDLTLEEILTVIKKLNLPGFLFNLPTEKLIVVDEETTVAIGERSLSARNFLDDAGDVKPFVKTLLAIANLPEKGLMIGINRPDNMAPKLIQVFKRQDIQVMMHPVSEGVWRFVKLNSPTTLVDTILNSLKDNNAMDQTDAMDSMSISAEEFNKLKNTSPENGHSELGRVAKNNNGSQQQINAYLAPLLNPNVVISCSYIQFDEDAETMNSTTKTVLQSDTGTVFIEPTSDNQNIKLSAFSKESIENYFKEIDFLIQ